jgi:diaminohydroxyphosphoribosylaminopyrimidine deaminase / 5-amino-6-(5-phosphoribosylamino)uracil reductase
MTDSRESALLDRVDEQWMRVALEMAELGRGWVEPNPMVGCVLTLRGNELSRGYHRRFGGPHAEVHALEGLSPEQVREATLYVTLEPCSHHGKTPPCVELVEQLRPRRVVIAMVDPFPEVAGRGIDRLRRAGIEVRVGVLETEAQRLNAPYLKLLNEKRPWVIAKWAMTLDGALATHQGDSKWITSPGCRAIVHGMRSVCDAIVIGSETALLDNPSLTARLPGATPVPRRAVRVVIDRRLRIPLDGHLVVSAQDWPVVVITDQHKGEIEQHKAETLRSMGVDVWTIPATAEAKVAEAHGPQWIVQAMGQRRWTNILIEGGGSLLGAFWDAGLVDQVDCFIAARVLGSDDARRAIRGNCKNWMNQSSGLARTTWREIDGDIHCRGFLDPCTQNTGGFDR